MRARLQHQDFVAVLQLVEVRSALQVVLEVAFVVCQHDAEARERDVFGHLASHASEHLAVGDHQFRGRITIQPVGHLVLFQYYGNRVVVEDVADHLHLRQDEPSFGGLRVDGCHEHHRVALADDIAQERVRDVGRGRHLLHQGLQHGGNACTGLRAHIVHVVRDDAIGQ